MPTRRLLGFSWQTDVCLVSISGILQSLCCTPLPLVDVRFLLVTLRNLSFSLPGE